MRGNRWFHTWYSASAIWPVSIRETSLTIDCPSPSVLFCTAVCRSKRYKSKLCVQQICLDAHHPCSARRRLDGAQARLVARRRPSPGLGWKAAVWARGGARRREAAIRRSGGGAEAREAAPRRKRCRFPRFPARKQMGRRERARFPVRKQMGRPKSSRKDKGERRTENDGRDSPPGSSSSPTAPAAPLPSTAGCFPRSSSR